MGHLFGSVFGLRRDESDVAFQMAAYHFLLLVTLYLLKPVRDSLFLVNRGPGELPFVFILTTAVVGPVALLHTRFGKRLSLGTLVDAVSLLLLLSLGGLRGLLHVGGAWTVYVFYAWVSVYGLLVTSQFWLLANGVFTSSQSKRVFTALSAGAIAGAVVGGEVTRLLVEEIGLSSESLLWIAGGVLLGATVLERWIRRGRTPEADGWPTSYTGARTPDGPFATLRQSHHLRLIVGIIALVVIVTTLVDYQFKTVAVRAFPGEEALTAFMGQFYGRVSIVALLVQFVLAPWLIRVAGIGGALSVLPGALALGSLGMLLMPGLAAGVLLRGAGQSLKHSVDRTGRELLFVPVSSEKKRRIKVFVDLFIDQGAEGLGGLLLLGLVVGAGASVQVLSGVTLGLIAVWGALAYRARASYVDLFRTKLRRQEGTGAATGPDQSTSDTDMEALLDALCSRAVADVRWALDTLEDGTLPVPRDAVLGLLDHPTAAIRAQAIRVLRARHVDGGAERVAEALRDLDPSVQLEAARYLYGRGEGNHTERLRRGLCHDDPQIQAATVGLIAEEGTPEEYALVDETLLRRLLALDGAEGVEARIHGACILGVLDRPYRNELLERLLQDEVAAVVRAALRAAGHTRDRTFVPRLVQALGEDAFRREARRGLVAFGTGLFRTLYGVLVDSQVDQAVRRHIPSVFEAQPSQLGARLLVRSLARTPIPVRHAGIRALSRLQKKGNLRHDGKRLDAAIEREVEHYAALGQILHLHRRSGDGPLGHESAELLRDYREEALERIFRLLGLRYNQRDIYDAYRGLTSDEPILRDHAVEFVDNLIDYGTRRYLLPLLDDPQGEQAATAGARLFNRRIRRWEGAIEYLRTAPDPRLVALVGQAPPRAGAPPISQGSGGDEVRAPH